MWKIADTFFMNQMTIQKKRTQSPKHIAIMHVLTSPIHCMMFMVYVFDILRSPVALLLAVLLQGCEHWTMPR